MYSILNKVCVFLGLQILVYQNSYIVKEIYYTFFILLNMNIM